MMQLLQRQEIFGTHLGEGVRASPEAKRGTSTVANGQLGQIESWEVQVILWRPLFFR